MAWGFPRAAWAVLADLQKREGVGALGKYAASSETQSWEERQFFVQCCGLFKTFIQLLLQGSPGVLPHRPCSLLCSLQDGPGGGDVRDHEGHSVRLQGGHLVPGNHAD